MVKEKCGSRMMKKREGTGDIQGVGLEQSCQAGRGSWCGSLNPAGGLEGRRKERGGEGWMERGRQGEVLIEEEGELQGVCDEHAAVSTVLVENREIPADSQEVTDVGEQR